MYDQYMNQVFPRKQIEKIGEIYLYTIESGDNLYQISKSFNTQMELVAALNSMHVNDIIYPGNQLLIPVLHVQPTAAKKQPAMPRYEAQPQPVAYPPMDMSRTMNHYDTYF